MASIVALGLPLAVASGLGLLWFVPFAGVGAVVAIRRPGTSIGWLLLALAWAHGLASFDPGATVPLLGVSGEALSTAAWPWVFVLYATLAIVLPAGEWPRGRPGLLVRGLLVVDAVFAVVITLGPDLEDFLVGPSIVILLACAGSLLVRTTRSRGVERQQLRWIASAIVLVVLALIVGVVVGAVVPAASTSGLAWVPVALAFPTVPVAIGVAVLRYRLYEIDTILNRAIVYGLLTAILAGGSAAIITVLERLFEGVIAPGSDATIVLTTLIVVSAFTPLKARLQARVDRSFKEAHDPGAVFTTLLGQLHDSPSPLSVERTMRRFMTVALPVFGAPGGEAIVTKNGVDTRIVVGRPIVGPAAEVAAARDALRLSVLLPIESVQEPGLESIRIALYGVLDELDEVTQHEPDIPLTVVTAPT